MSITIRPANRKATTELNVANGNFVTLFSALGFSADECWGEIEPVELIEALHRTPWEWCLRQEQVKAYSQETGEPNWICAGINPERAMRYWKTLEQIACEANRLQCRVEWT
jgi:hypothetical protein